MGFSDKMRETLGSEGAQLELLTDEHGWVAQASPGQSVDARVRLAGGTKTARVEGLILRLVVRHRHWSDGQGMSFNEDQAQELESRSHLMPAWSRDFIAQTRVELDAEIDAGSERELTVHVPVPEHCDRTTAACTVTLHVQADIRGQIDPTATGKLRVA